MKTMKVFPAIVLSLCVAGAAWAQKSSSNPELIARLEEMQSKHDWQARTRTGLPKLLLSMHQAKVDRILGELKSGRPVDLKEIDTLYKQHNQGVPGRVD